MSFYPIKKIEDSQEPVNHDIDSWIQNYKETFLEHPHDTSQLTLILPDDCLVVSGPTRLRHARGGRSDDFWIMGFANQVNYSETRNVQPLKALGSRRHIFAATNTPVQIQLGRLMILGLNTLRSLYANAQFGTDISIRNTKVSNIDGDRELDGGWLNNVEEDLFRVPIGLGIIFNAPATLAGSMRKMAGAVYFEATTLISHQVALQSGQAFIMEQVTLMADRALPWTSVGTSNGITKWDPDPHAQVSSVSAMD